MHPFALVPFRPVALAVVGVQSLTRISNDAIPPGSILRAHPRLFDTLLPRLVQFLHSWDMALGKVALCSPASIYPRLALSTRHVFTQRIFVVFVVDVNKPRPAKAPCAHEGEEPALTREGSKCGIGPSIVPAGRHHVPVETQRVEGPDETGARCIERTVGRRGTRIAAEHELEELEGQRFLALACT